MNGELLTAEALVLVTGLFPTHAPSEAAVRSARRLSVRIQKRIEDFLAAEKQAPLKWKRPPLQVDLHRELLTPIDGEKLKGWEVFSDPILLGQYMMLVEHAKQKVIAAWPLYPETSLGLRNCELAPDEYGEIWQLTRTLSDIEVIFDDLDAMILLPDQITAFADAYPDTYQEIKRVAALLLEPYMEVEGTIKPKKVLNFAREDQIRTLLQLPQDGVIEIAPQDGDGQQKAPTRADKAKAAEDAADGLTIPSEHTTAKRVES